MAHSNKIREFVVTAEGIRLIDVYLGPEGVLTGSSRRAQEARESASALTQKQELDRKQRELERKRLAMEAQIAAIRASFELEEGEALKEIVEDQGRESMRQQDRVQMAISRKAELASPKKNGSTRKVNRK